MTAADDHEDRPAGGEPTDGEPAGSDGADVGAGPDRIPDVDRGPVRDLSERARRLTARAAATDRRERFRQRASAVRRREERRRRRQRRIEAALLLLLLVGPPVVGGLGAGLLGVAVGTGVAVGVVVGLGLAALRVWTHRYAVRRGASAWDWRSGRYVSRGDPSRRVQSMTDRPDRRPDEPRGR